MIKNWKQFNENKVNPDSYLDMRMQEIKELLDSNDESTSFIYEWENKDDHELYVNFSANGMAFRYEFDIDNMTISKFVGEVTDFVEDVESLEQGISIIEKDINSLLGISESILLESKYEEMINISVETGEGNSFLKNKFSDLELNRKLMKTLDNKFDLNFGEISDKHKINNTSITDVCSFLKSLGLKREEQSIGDRKKITFKGYLSLKDFRKIK